MAHEISHHAVTAFNLSCVRHHHRYKPTAPELRSERKRNEYWSNNVTTRSSRQALNEFLGTVSLHNVYPLLICKAEGHRRNMIDAQYE